MTKADIVDNICKQTGLDKPVVEETVNAMMHTIKDSMIQGKNIYMRGFGSFVIRKRNAKQGRNISKKTFVKIPAHNVPWFKPCKTFSNGVKANVKVK